MDTNLLPSVTYEALDKAKRNFLWGSFDGKRKLHMVPWEQVCQHRNRGGIGIRQSKFHNIALLMKILCGIIKEPDALWVKLLKGK